MIECKLCNNKMKWLTPHITRTHKMSTKEYLEKFPGSKLKDQETYEIFRKKNQAIHDSRSMEERKRRAKIGQAGHTDESRKRVGESQKIRIAKMTPEERSKNASYGGQGLANKLSSSIDARLEHGKVLSNGWKIAFEKNPKLRIECWERMLHAASIMHEKLRAMSDEELATYLDNSFLRTPKKYFFEYKGITYGVRSSYEKKVLKALVDLNLDFKYEPFFLLKSDGHKYRIDFLVDNRLILEVKAEYWYNEEQNLLREESARKVGYDYVLLMEKEIFGNLHSIIREIVLFGKNMVLVKSDELLESPKASTATAGVETLTANAKKVEDKTMDNQQPSLVMSERVAGKVQRLDGEAQTANKPSTSVRHT